MNRQDIPELVELMGEYLSGLDDKVKGEWYGSDRQFARAELLAFLDWLPERLK